MEEKGGEQEQEGEGSRRRRGGRGEGGGGEQEEKEGEGSRKRKGEREGGSNSANTVCSNVLENHFFKVKYCRFTKECPSPLFSKQVHVQCALP